MASDKAVEKLQSEHMNLSNYIYYAWAAGNLNMYVHICLFPPAYAIWTDTIVSLFIGVYIRLRANLPIKYSTLRDDLPILL